MRVLICGGRNFSDEKFARETLDCLHREHTFTHVIEGAARGADRLAGEWARARSIPLTEYPADWARLGRRAGPNRNEQMLQNGKPDLVIAFPGGRGTAHMVRISLDAGVKVIEIALADSEGVKVALPPDRVD